MSIYPDLTAALETRHRQHLYRRRLQIETPQGTKIGVDKKTYLSFCSNDYLGLANHPEVAAACKRGIDTYGLGSGASHLVTGHMTPHHALEEELAEFLGVERTLLFSTGYMANLGVVSALLGRSDLVVEDRLNHASLVDAGLLSRAKFRRYKHADSESAAKLIQNSSARRRLLVTDGVFSMDGDLAPLPSLVDLAQCHRASVLVDDAHGIGVMGANGRGTSEYYNIKIADPLILVGTLGKAFGTFGAYVAGPAALIETLIQAARTYIYTTALPPAVAEATRASLRLVQGEPWRRQHLVELISYFRQCAAQTGLQLMPSLTPIQPLIVKDPQTALALSERLKRHGIIVPAIRPPTVPKGTARLRFTLSADHTRDHIDRLFDCFDKAGSVHQDLET